MQHSLVVKDSLSPPVEEQTGCCALHLVEVKEGLYQTDVVHAENTMWADKGWIPCPCLAQILWRKYGRRTRSRASLGLQLFSLSHSRKTGSTSPTHKDKFSSLVLMQVSLHSFLDSASLAHQTVLQWLLHLYGILQICSVPSALLLCGSTPLWTALLDPCCPPRKKE